MTATQDHVALMSAALAEIKAGEQALARGIARLELALKAAVEHGVQGLPSPTAPVSDHRREHRPGKPRIIPNDPDLQAIIRARTDRMTFAEIAADVAQHFPPERRVGKSAIHDWFRKGTRRKNAKP